MDGVKNLLGGGKLSLLTYVSPCPVIAGAGTELPKVTDFDRLVGAYGCTEAKFAFQFEIKLLPSIVPGPDAIDGVKSKVRQLIFIISPILQEVEPCRPRGRST